jgi:two-component system NtrC family sensor kinase
MMKLIACSLFCLVTVNLFAQRLQIDSLKREAKITQNDTLRLVWLRSIADIYSEINPDSSYYYAEQSLNLSRKMNLTLDEGGSLRAMGYAFMNRGNYPRALQTLLSAMELLEDPKSEKNVLIGKFPGDDDIMYRIAAPHAQRASESALTHENLGVLYANSNNYEKALHHHLLARQKAEQSGNVPLQSIISLTLNRVYLQLGKNDSAMISIQMAYEQAVQSGYKRYLGSVLLNMGRTYVALGDTVMANEYFRKALVASAEQGYFRGVVASNLLLADFCFASGKNDSAFQFIEDALSVAQNLDFPDLLLRSYTRLNRYYRIIGNNDSIVKYQALVIKINEDLFNTKQAQEFQNIDFDVQQQQQELISAEKEYRNRLQKYLLLGGLGVFSIVAFILFHNNRQKQKANKVLESTLTSLRSTQSLLIQSEKMASLGELTAGIAHEIQNPLNFVNNFSEVSSELISELHEELTKGDIDQAKAIATNVNQNLERINHHGKRADAIVKGMLQHSRTSTGQKEPTDISALCDKYLRLAYHGFRAKDQSFNVTTKTDFDESIGNISVVRQDIGRVVINLITNAFYTVSEKKRQSAAEYEPIVSLSTKRQVDKVLISVKDNGNGIPKQLLDKIFQPFFTTKPTGQGTGLGLSLSYDIVKAHGGEIKVETKEKDGSEFIIYLSIQKVQENG